MKKRGSGGFTLMELMIVAAIISILTAIAIPKFGSILRKAHEGTAKGSLGLVRAALLVYYGDMEGQYPQYLTALTVDAKYLPALPTVEAPGWHRESAAIRYGLGITDAGGWQYNNMPGNSSWGKVRVNCIHTDSNGTIWALY